MNYDLPLGFIFADDGAVVRDPDLVADAYEMLHALSVAA